MAVEIKQSRRGSFEYEDLAAIAPQPASFSSSSPPNPAGPRTRVLSNPNITPLPGYGHGSASAGPYRTSFNVGTPNGHTRNGSVSSNGTSYARSSLSSTSGRQSFSSTTGNGIPVGAHGAHTRSPSMSSDVGSPTFRSSFSSVNNDMAAWKSSLHESANGNTSPPPPQSSSAQSRRHARIHSRNLSIYFPRPGTTTVHSIAEDGAQEIEAPVSIIPTAGSTPQSKVSTPQSSNFVSPAPLPRSQLGGGFKFGGRPPQSATSISSTGSTDQLPGANVSNSTSNDTQPSSVPMSKANTAQTGTSQTTSRRGHHHRHSLSHSFFSFMEPSSNAASPGHLRQPSGSPSISVTGPTPPGTATPMTALTANGWGPISPFVTSTTSAAFPPAQLIPPKRTVSLQPASLPSPSTQRSSSLLSKLLALPQDMQLGLIFSVVEGFIGCGVWVMGQHVESLACTGLAYWIAFDAISVILGVYGGFVDAGAGQGSLRLPYGAKRTEIVSLFAQAIYLLFSAVYICKETIEHALLSAGDAGHHHHHPKGAVLNTGLNYPLTFLWLSFISLSLSSILLKGNAKILDATGIYIPSPRQLLRSFSTNRSINLPPRPSSFLLLSNPYTLFPLLCTMFLLSASVLPLNQDSQRTADMLIAGIEAFGTAYLAWPACLTLGKVLLQMAPERTVPTAGESLSTKGTMESLLRAMKEIERHPQVLHLPAPHVWQVSPASTYLQYTETPKSRLGENGHTSSLSIPPVVKRRGTIGGAGGNGQVVVTVELHVKKELEDIECLELTRWAWQRCVNALGQGDEGISVGIVRG